MAGKIIVTGATGNIGTPLLDALQKRGANFTAVTHSAEKASALRAKGIDAVNAEMTGHAALNRVFEGGKALFLLTPFFPQMAQLTSGIAAAAKHAGISHIVRLSGMGAEHEQITLAKWHRAAERAVEESGVAWTHLRPNSFMQNYVNFHSHSIKEQGAFYLPHGNGAVSFVDTRDIADAAAEILVNPAAHAGKAYTLTGPAAITNHQAAQTLSSAAGKNVAYVDIPESKAREGMAAMGIPDWMVDGLLELYAVNKAGHTATVTGDIKNITGKAARSFGDFAKDYAGAFK
ncbi:MAG: SDR family oxidoreductase [Nitrospinae bacterium]|nr:SDR family oxidoreductase [Nitrospinota bacterium]